MINRSSDNFPVTLLSLIHIYIGDLEDCGDMDVDIDADFGDVDVVEEPVEPEVDVYKRQIMI